MNDFWLEGTLTKRSEVLQDVDNFGHVHSALFVELDISPRSEDGRRLQTRYVCLRCLNKQTITELLTRQLGQTLVVRCGLAGYAVADKGFRRTYVDIFELEKQ